MRAEPFTLLTLTDYAKILGLDPLHFAGGYSNLRPEPTCSDVWYQYDWQNPDLVSRHQVATLIQGAEQDIADYLGYWPAPVWIEDERQPYSHLYDPVLIGWGQNVRYRARSVRLNWGEFIQGGQRATSLIQDEVAWVASDPDGDGFNEIATFIINNVSSTLDPCEVHMYYKVYDVLDEENTRTDPSSTGADPAWEIRPIKCSLSGTTLTVRCNKWQLFRPQLFENLAPEGIDADDITSYVDATIFYRVYNDPTTSVSFVWNSDISCTDEACSGASQSGCVELKSKRNSFVIPTPATYNATTGTFTLNPCWDQGYEPDFVRFWYRAGLTDPHASCDTLNSYWARIITMLATARTDWPICTCENTNNALLSDHWRKDVALVKSGEGALVNDRILDNPFGTRVGEVEAWKRVSRFRGRVKGQAVIT